MRRALALTAAALLATLTACGSTEADSDPGRSSGAVEAEPTKDKAAEEKAALEESVRTYTKALFGGDPDTGYPLVSKRCQKDMSEQEFAVMSEDANHQYGNLTIKTLSVDELSGNLARVSYGVGVPQFEREGQAWTREDDTWKWDAC